MRILFLLFVSASFNLLYCAPIVQTEMDQNGSDKREQMRLLKQQMEAEYEYKYTGFIGPYPIHFWFKNTGSYDCPRGGSTFEGFYYYDKSGSSNRLLLKGYCCGASIQFTEYNENGTITGGFSGIWGGDEIQGSWNSGAKELEFKLIGEGAKVEPVVAQSNNTPTPDVPAVVKETHDEKTSSDLPVTYNGAGNKATPQSEAQTEPRNIETPEDHRSAMEKFISLCRDLKILYTRYPHEANGIAVGFVFLLVLIIIFNQRRQNALLKKQNEILEKKNRRTND